VSDEPSNVIYLEGSTEPREVIEPPKTPPRDWRNPNKLSERVRRKAQERALADGALMYSIHVNDMLAVLDEYQVEVEEVFLGMIETMKKMSTP
jgi:hypothetical protein